MMGVKKLGTRARAHKKHMGSPVDQRKLNKNEGINDSKKSKQKKTLVIAQEIKFARVLASNNKKARAKMLKNLKAWITVRSQSSFVFTETDFMRLWKGLFYCMWMSDKPLVQEELAESISNLIHCFETMESAVVYTKCALKTLSTEWFGIDQYRLDKFQMLVRRVLRQTFVMCKKRDWDEEWTKGIAKVFQEILLDNKGSIGFKFHITETFMEELSKVCEGDIPEDMVTEFLRPFAIYLAAMEDERQIRNIMQHIFRYLIFQSDIGIEYMEKFDAWRKAGYPTGSIEAMKKVIVSDEELEDSENNEEDDEEEINIPKASTMDPRAGRVNVDLPQIPFDPLQISNLIKNYKFHPSSTTKTRRQITRLIEEFSQLSKGTMPLGVQKVDIPKRKNSEINSEKAALKLIKFQDELYADSAKNRGKNKRKNELLEPKCKKMKLQDTNDGISTGEISERNSKKLKKTPDSKYDPNENLSPKKKSLQKEFKMKNGKIKTKKLKSVKNALNGQLMDGIDDFMDFKKSPSVNKSKKIKYDLNNSWDVTISDDERSIVSPSKLKKSQKISVTAAKVNSSSKPLIVEDIRVDKIPWLLPVSKKLNEHEETQSFKTPKKEEVSLTTQVTSSTKKRVKIMLQKNTAQHTSEYFKQLRLSPQIPYDANRKPRAGVLKPSPLASPVNPFYKKL